MPINVKMPTIVTFDHFWHFNMYEHGKFHAKFCLVLCQLIADID